MKTLGMLLLCGVGAAAADRPPKTSDCFKVNALIKTDEDHYWADWTNSCPYTIDSVYVMVKFADRFRKYMGDGVWPMYYVTPGMHRVTRFSIPALVAGFEFVTVNKITTNSVEALK